MNTSVQNISFASFSSSSLNPEAYFMVFSVCYAVNILLGLPTNIYVIKLILTGAEDHMASEFFALNLAVAESLYCLLNVLVLLDYYIFNYALYSSRSFTTGFICSSRPMFQCCICVERYLAVVHPVVFLRYKPVRYKVVCSGLVWCWIIGLSCLAFYLSLSAMFFYVNMGQYLTVFLVQLFCCLSVLKALKRPGPGDGDRERDGSNSMKRKAFSIILIILLSFVLNFLPILVTVSLQSYMDESTFYLALAISFIFSVATGFVQPLLYLHRTGWKVFCI